jgi:DNA-binding NarL/FixJ family response regulator
MTLAQLLAENAGDLEPREFQIATLMARGRTNQEISNELSIAFKTVKNNVSKIWYKPGVFDVAYARNLRTQARADSRVLP